MLISKHLSKNKKRMSMKANLKELLLPFFLFCLLLILPDVYVWWKYLMPSGTIWLSIVWYLPSAATITTFYLFRSGIYHNTLLRAFIGMILCLDLPKLLFTLLQFILPTTVSLLCAIALIAVFIYGFFFGWRRIVVRTATCESPLLPLSFDGYRILQLSDLHLGTYQRNPGFIKKLVRIVNEQKPDLVVFTGDLVNVRADEVLPFLADLSKITAPDGVYSVMGNHDYCEYGMETNNVNKHNERQGAFAKEPTALRNQRVLEYLEEKIGWHLLMNEHVNIIRIRQEDGINKSESISLIGVENISRPPFKTMGDLSKAMEGLVNGTFKILLSHDPTHWRRGVLHKTDIALTLSGHTHAGQLKIGRFSPVKWAYNEWGGKYVEDGSMLHVSLGIGGTVPFRFGAWPEVNVIKLTSKQ